MQRIVFLFLVSAAFLEDPSAVRSEVPSIMEFVAARDKWPQRVGRPLTLEGRYTSMSGSEMRFAGCDMPFLLPNSYVKPRASVKNVEVSGRIEKHDGELVFVIQSLRSLPSDHETLELKRLSIDTGHPETLYELGHWAVERGTFYGDEELVSAGRQLLQRGLSQAFDLLEEDDVDGMRSLAARVAEFGLGERLQHEYLHEANRAALDRELKQPMPDYRSLLRHVQRDLPGADQPLPPGQEKLRKDYEREPRLAYRVADNPTRRIFERVLFSEVLLEDITRDAAEDGSNGEEIAARIEERLPERTDLIGSYRERELEYLSKRLNQLRREEMLDLAQRYEARREPEQAVDVKRRWLDGRIAAASANGPLALVELAEDYLNFLQDEKKAARMYQLAYESNPQGKTASQWLTDHGYELQNGQWVHPGDPGQGGPDDLAAAIREGRVVEGMSGAQVQAALGGTPNSVARIASAGQVVEVWLYEALGVSVQLSRRSHQKELHVRRVTNAP